MKILITDCFTRKAFDIYNIIRRYYNDSHIILASSQERNWREQAIYSQKIGLLKKTDQLTFANDLLKISYRYTNDVIVYIPVEEDTTVFFIEFIRKSGQLNFKFCLPGIKSYNIARNKYLLNKFCQDNGIASPLLFETITSDEFAKRTFRPLIIKPRIGTGSKGIIHIDSLKDLIKVENLNQKEYVIQEKIKNGKDVKGAFFLCRKGKVVSSYCHERIRTFPIEGGVTVYSKVSINESILKQGGELLAKLEWDGFAMIEFLWDENDNNYKVIEINPRLWGSILLSEMSGANFINNYINYCLDDKPSFPERNDNAKIRWLPFEIMHLITSLKQTDNFWKLDTKNTCYINITYAKWYSIFFFHILFFVNLSSVKTFFSKWRK